MRIITSKITQVNSLMAEADVDHNGKLDLTEFILLMHKNNPFVDPEEENEDEMRLAFR